MAVRDKTEFMPNSIYYITFTILKWQVIFTGDKYFNLVYKWFDYVKENYHNQINGYVTMPTHLHTLIYISEKSPELSKLIQNSKRFLAYEIIELLKEDKRYDILKIFEENARKEKGAKHKVFEERYDSKIIENESIFIEKLNYIHKNPLSGKWRLADRPEDYKHSSASNYILGKGVYDIDFPE